MRKSILIYSLLLPLLAPLAFAVGLWSSGGSLIVVLAKNKDAIASAASLTTMLLALVATVYGYFRFVHSISWAPRLSLELEAVPLAGIGPTNFHAVSYSIKNEGILNVYSRHVTTLGYRVIRDARSCHQSENVFVNLVDESKVDTDTNTKGTESVVMWHPGSSIGGKVVVPVQREDAVFLYKATTTLFNGKLKLTAFAVLRSAA